MRQQNLVEVKNFRQKQEDPNEKFSIKKDYYNKLAKYAELNSVNLKLAIYFSIWNQWVMLSIDAFEEDGDSFKIDLPTATIKSEMSLIGDMMIGTSPNLEIHLLTNEEEAEEIGNNGEANFTIRDIRFYCSDNEIVDNFEKGMVLQIIKFGNWTNDKEIPIIKNNRLMGIKYIFSPETPTAENFSIIGYMSSIISRANRQYTVKNGKVIALDVKLPSFIFRVFTLKDYNGINLPLWKFVIERNPD